MASWWSLDTWIHDGRNPERRKVANNTYAVRRGDDIAIRLHETDIMTYDQNGLVTFDTGEWYTVTTKDRFNHWGPGNVSVYATRGIWSLYVTIGGKVQETRYWDGMTLDPNRGIIVNADDAPDFETGDRENKRTRALIREYVKGFTDDIITGLPEVNTSGDCLYCQIGSPFDNEHLRQHLRERYYMPSLVMNAYVARKFGDPAYVASMDVARYPARVRETVGKYLRRELLDNVATR